MDNEIQGTSNSFDKMVEVKCMIKKVKMSLEKKPPPKRLARKVPSIPMTAPKNNLVVSHDVNHYQEYLNRGRDWMLDSLHDEDGKQTTSVQQYEVNHFLREGWRFNEVVQNELAKFSKESDDSEDESKVQKRKKLTKNSMNTKKEHLPWCFMCGTMDDEGNRLQKCSVCIASYHQQCSNWQKTNTYRLTLIPEMNTMITQSPYKDLHQLVEKSHCQVCVYGPSITYGDLVWHRIRPWPHWPARVLQPGELPFVLANKKPEFGEYFPLRFYADKDEFAWARRDQMCRMECYSSENLAPEVRPHYMRACDDFLLTYVTNKLQLED